MPRQARFDAPGTLHHVIVRGIERRRIVDDNADRENFLNRLAHLSVDTNTRIFAWALMENHSHILLRSSKVGISAFMQRLLTGYAISYNRRHRRWGHLFQNRYKSIICDEDPYFKELVRYIHLNPIRANQIKNLMGLNQYRWSGHSAIMGVIENDWQDIAQVLRCFGTNEGEATKAYLDFVEKGIAHGRRPELMGGGLIRSMGGWSAVKTMRRTNERELSDSRILGSGEFVKRVIDEAKAKIKYQLPVKQHNKKIDDFIGRICKNENVYIKELKAGIRRKEVSKARALIAIGLVKEFGVSLAEAARQLGVSTAAISNIIKRAH